MSVLLIILDCASTVAVVWFVLSYLKSSAPKTNNAVLGQYPESSPAAYTVCARRAKKQN
jgi:hypothetical protein